MYQNNPEINQDRVSDTFELFEKYGFVLFPQNRKAYENISNRISGSILEAGCGNGVGANIIGADTATDKLEKNIKFAQQFYPDIRFGAWDLNGEPYKEKNDTVVAVEVIEHIENYKRGLQNLIKSANKEIWLSTPNRSVLNQERPDNPFHVHEFMPSELCDLAVEYGVKKVEIYHWDTMELLDKDTKVNPLIYHLIL